MRIDFDVGSVRFSRDTKIRKISSKIVRSEKRVTHYISAYFTQQFLQRKYRVLYANLTDVFSPKQRECLWLGSWSTPGSSG